jgi:hypothetical protein
MKQIISQYFILKFVLFMSINSFATERCMKEHLKEAIALNSERRDMYANLTEGKSIEVSNKLIGMEKTTLLMLRLPFWNFDKLLGSFDKYGLQPTCDTFISMKTVTTFDSEFLAGPPSENTALIDTKKIRQILETALETENVSVLKEKLLEQRAQLNTEPRLNCMSRHIIESTLRIATLFPNWILKMQDSKDKEKFEKIVFRLLKNHIFALKSAGQIDELARPIQLAGVPIICQDVPVIEFE